MSEIETLLRYENEHSALKLRATQYLRHEYDSLLRDVVALANADVSGDRHIALGVDLRNDVRQLIGFSKGQCVAPGTYERLVEQHIEPPLRVRYRVCELQGKWFGVLAISDCTNAPYLISTPLAPGLRRGEGWIRRGVELRPLGRADLDRMYARRLDSEIFQGGIKVGFAGSKLLSKIRLSTIGPYERPSQQAAAKLSAAIEVHEMLSCAKTLASSTIRRLTHLRLFGHDAPYKVPSLERLRLDRDSVADEYLEEDAYQRFERLGHRVNFTLINRGTQTIVDASARIELPNGAGVEVAPRLFVSRDSEPGQASAAGAARVDYPPVTMTDELIRVTASLGDVARDSPVTLFREPLRVVINERAVGRKVPVRVTLYGRNLPTPIVATLCVVGTAA